MFTSSSGSVNPRISPVHTTLTGLGRPEKALDAVLVARLPGAPEASLPVSELAGAGLALEDAAAIRKFPAFRHKQAREGRWAFGPTGALVSCESQLEMTAVAWLEFSGAAGVSSQPCRISWADGTAHVPDLFARMSDGSGVLVDVRPLEKAEQSVFQMTAQVCEQAGWGYVVFAGLPSATRELILALASYRAPVCAPPERERLVAWLGQPPYGAAMLRFSAQHGVALGTVKAWAAHLLWHRHLPVGVGMSFAELLS